MCYPESWCIVSSILRLFKFRWLTYLCSACIASIVRLTYVIPMLVSPDITCKSAISSLVTRAPHGSETEIDQPLITNGNLKGSSPKQSIGALSSSPWVSRLLMCRRSRSWPSDTSRACSETRKEIPTTREICGSSSDLVAGVGPRSFVWPRSTTGPRHHRHGPGRPQQERQRRAHHPPTRKDRPDHARRGRGR